MTDTVNLSFTAAELLALYHALAQVGIEMDDDGREGAFAASPLKPIYDRVRDASNAANPRKPR